MRIECERKHPGALSLGALWEVAPPNIEVMIRECDRRMYQEKKKIKAARAASEQDRVAPLKKAEREML